MRQLLPRSPSALRGAGVIKVCILLSAQKPEFFAIALKALTSLRGGPYCKAAVETA